jgi:hypothetical protein
VRLNIINKELVKIFSFVNISRIMITDNYSFHIDVDINNATYTFNGVMVVDRATDIITEVYQESDNSMTNILYTTSEGNEEIFTKYNPYSNAPYKVYSTRNTDYMSWYDNALITQKLTFDEMGIIMKSLGPEIDSLVLSSLGDPTVIIYTITGDSETNQIYITGVDQTINTIAGFNGTISITPLNVSCFAGNTLIMTSEGPVVITNLAVGSLVPTLSSGNKAVVSVGKRVVKGYSFQMYGYGECGLEITGKHSILVDELTEEQREQIPSIIGSLKQAEGKWLLPACLDDNTYKISLYGDIPLYHVVLENQDDSANYGILANGMWVESCSKNDFINFSQMDEINF